jgi:hypothetical protein
MVDANYAKAVQNTMRKYNKKVSRGNDSIVKGSLIVNRPSLSISRCRSRYEADVSVSVVSFISSSMGYYLV